MSELSVTELVSRIIGYLKGNAKISADHNFWFSWSLERLCKQWMQKQCDIRFFFTLMMTSALVVEMWVTTTDNSPAQDYTHPDDQTTLLHVNFGFKTFTVKQNLRQYYMTQPDCAFQVQWKTKFINWRLEILVFLFIATLVGLILDHKELVAGPWSWRLTAQR